jgi:hypothetical protein
MASQAKEANEAPNEGQGNKDVDLNPQNPVKNHLWLIIVGLLLGTFSIFSASSFRDFFYALYEMIVPMSEKSLQGGVLLVMYRFFCFLIITSLFVIASVALVTSAA